MRHEDRLEDRGARCITTLRSRKHRERRQKTADQLAEELEIPRQEYETIEAGQSGIEEYGPLLLHFAEIIEQPVFNLFYPCGLPLDKLEVNDYP